MTPSNIKIDSLETFAYKYNTLKDAGMIPKDIAIELQEEYNCKPTCYYHALRRCRELGLVHDTYAETKAAALQRQKDEALARKNRLRTLVDNVKSPIVSLRSGHTGERGEYELDNIEVTKKENNTSLWGKICNFFAGIRDAIVSIFCKKKK